MGTGLCPLPTDCCSKKGYCGTGAEYCSLSTCFAPTSSSSNNCRTCGNGIVGSGLCPKFTDCCSSSGMCGSSSSFCSSGNSTTCLSGPCTSASSKRHITGYWTNWRTDGYNAPLKLSQVSSYYTIVAVSFGVRCNIYGDSDGSVCFSADDLGIGYTNQQLKTDVATLKSRGQSVILSIGGGADSGKVVVNSDASVLKFVKTTCTILTQFGFQGIDIDLEHGINSFYLAKAVRQVHQQCGGGSKFVLTFAPVPSDLTSYSTPYAILIDSLSDLTTVANIQLYNSGPLTNALGSTVSPGTLDYLVSIAELSILNGVLVPHQTGIGVPAKASSCYLANCGYLASPDILVNAVSCLATGKNCGNYKPFAKYASLGGIMIWSINEEVGTGLAKKLSDYYK